MKSKLNVNHDIDTFFSLVRAGLWGEKTTLSNAADADFLTVFQIAEEQSVVGLVAAGLEQVLNLKAPQEIVLQFVGQALLIEQRNKMMNGFICELIEKMRADGIYALLVKGQGIAQCYERPLWRACGDIDFYLSDTNFNDAKLFFRQKVDTIDPEKEGAQHINMHYGQWVVEIHSNQYVTISSRINKVMDEIHHDLFCNGSVRSWWINNTTTVFLPSPDNDVLIVFTHFLNHFYNGGIGIRQICDWCRLLWTFRDSINQKLLYNRLRRMGLLNVWQTFGSFAVDYLGMPKTAMPFYDNDICKKKKSKNICSFILEVGNFGHKRDMSYYCKYPKVISKCISMYIRCSDSLRHMPIFPYETIKFLPCIIFNGLKTAIRGV